MNPPNADTTTTGLPATPWVPPESNAFVNFSTFYRATLQPLRTYLSRLLGDRAEAQDIAHDAFLKTYWAMQGRPVNEPRSYLFTTARRLAVNFQVRRASKMQPVEAALLEAKSELAPAPSEAIMSGEDRQAFKAAVQTLSPACHDILILRIQDGLSPKEIAQKLGLAESTVNNQISRSLRIVREHIAALNRTTADPRGGASR